MNTLANFRRQQISTKPWRSLLLAALLLAAVDSRGEVCTTQSQMKPADRDAIASAARTLSAKIQSNDISGLRQQSVPELTKDYTSMTSLVAATATKIASAPLVVDQVYLLDATNLKTLGDGTNQDAQFFCSLNNSIAEATFFIPALPPGRYAYAQVLTRNPTAPWRLAFLMRQDMRQDPAGTWAMAGFYPRALTAAGHDGLWYWTQAREQVKEKHLWTGYLMYQTAQSLLQPAAFVGSTHLENLHKESVSSAPPALSEGISPDMPLVVKGQGGAEFRFTNLTTDDSLGGDKLYVVVHLAPDPTPDPSSPAAPAAKAAPKPATLSPRDRNTSAMVALLAAYPELKSSFGGVWVFADAPGKSPFVSEQTMADIR